MMLIHDHINLHIELIISSTRDHDGYGNVYGIA